MKKKVLSLILAITMISAMFVVSGCGKESEPETITSDMTLVQGINPQYAPFTSVDGDGNVSGFDVELCQALCEELGWNYENAQLNWDEKDSALLAGDCDCIWSAFPMEEHEDDYAFSVPYGTASQVVLVKKDSGLTTWDDLAGRMVAVQAGTAAYENLNSGVYADFAKTFSALIVEVSAELCFEDLNKGAIDAIIVDDTIANYLIKDNPDEYVMMSENLGWNTYAVAFRKEDGELAKRVSEGLKKLMENGKFDEIASHYPEIKPFLSVGE